MYQSRMHRYLDCQLKTKFDVFEKTIVFTTSKSLNERFAMNQTRRAFILNNGYTALYKDNSVTGRVAFENRRSLDIHKRFSLYQRGDLKVIEKKVFRNENKNHLQSRLAEIGYRRRTVLKPRKLKNEEPTKYYHEESEITAVQSPDYYNINSSTDYIDVNTPRSSRSCKLVKTEQSNRNDKFMQNSFTFDRGAVKRTWEGRAKSKDDNCLKDSEGSEPIVYSPFPSYEKKSDHYIRQSLYKWRRRPPTKEELDDELDRYMAEAKLKPLPINPVKDDVDSFVREYMLETEKCLNGTEDINVE